MKSRLATTLTLVLTALFFTLSGPALVAQTESQTETCLMCHGPFEGLVEATKGYTWEGGEVVSPHQYLPHDSKTVADCTLCHKAHPIPPSASDIAAMPKPNPSVCFECHHTKRLTCGNCHPVAAE